VKENVTANAHSMHRTEEDSGQVSVGKVEGKREHGRPLGCLHFRTDRGPLWAFHFSETSPVIWHRRQCAQT
jgi:hypothetical protein